MTWWRLNRCSETKSPAFAGGSAVHMLVILWLGRFICAFTSSWWLHLFSIMGFVQMFKFDLCFSGWIATQLINLWYSESSVLNPFGSPESVTWAKHDLVESNWIFDDTFLTFLKNRWRKMGTGTEPATPGWRFWVRYFRFTASVPGPPVPFIYISYFFPADLSLSLSLSLSCFEMLLKTWMWLWLEVAMSGVVKSWFRLPRDGATLVWRL